MNKEIGVGIIGSGLRGALVLGPRIIELKKETGFRLKAICDKLPGRMKEVNTYLQLNYLTKGFPKKIKKYTDYKQLVDDPDIDLIIITTPTHFHREPCEYALKSGKKVYLDKPIAVTLEDSLSLAKMVEETGNPLLMGFTRRYEASWRKVFELKESGIIGNLQMMQLRSVIPYVRYYHFWHRRNEWSGGALNDKSSHHFDVFNWFAGSNCISLSALGGQSPQFAPEENPPEGCFKCKRDCPYHIMKDPLFDEMKLKIIPSSWKNSSAEEDRIDTCVFKKGADITDHCFCQLEYKNGIKANLFLCIYGPDAPDQETFELIGSKGRILLNRHTGIIDLYSNYGRTHETIDARDDEFQSSHFGADLTLVRDMKQFMDGKLPIATVGDGHESLRMVTAAQESIDCHGKQIIMEK